MKNEIEAALTQVQFAEGATLDWMNNVIQAHETRLNSLKNYREQFVEACAKVDPIATPINVLAWFVGDVTQNLASNLRIDLAVNHTSAMAISTTRLGEAHKKNRETRLSAARTAR